MSSTQTSIKIAQVNIHHAKAASAVVTRMFTKQQLGIVLLQEPWVFGGNIRGLSCKNGKVVWYIRQDNPRSCILINTSKNYTLLAEFSTRDLVAIQTRLEYDGRGRDIILASGYFAGDRETPPSEVQNLIRHCVAMNTPCLIGCDANAHNEEWGSTDTNERGEYLLEFLVKENLDVFNIGIEPTFITRVRKEVLDITFGSTFFTHIVKRWAVSNEPSMSDHRIIRFDIEGSTLGKRSYRNPRKTNWENYLHHLSNNLSHIGIKSRVKNNMELETAVEELQSCIISAYEESCPIKTATHTMEVPWWNRNLTTLRAETRRLFNNAKRNGDWSSYKTSLTEYNKEIRKAKRSSFRSFCETISDTPTAARLHRAMAKGKCENASSLRRPDGTYTGNEEQRLLYLLDTHFPGSAPYQNTHSMENQIRPNSIEWKRAAEIITGERIEWAISTFQPFKSPGVDGIFPVLLQKGAKELIPFLLNIFRGSLALGYIPEKWRRAKIIFIPKLGKKDITNPKSFRPISLTPFPLKTMEKVVDIFTRETTLKVNPLHCDQHAYRKGRSTETALYALTNFVGKALTHKEVALCTFLDIEGAFDNTSHDAVRRALERRKVDLLISRWIGKMLSTRSAESNVDHKVISVSTTRGCPQGGVLSPLIWSLVVDELLTNLTNRDITCQGYADDIVIMTKGKFESTLCDRTQEGLRLVERWCQTVGLRVNPSKTTMIPFTNKRKLNNMHPIYLNGEKLEISKETKYLGLILDSKLLWNSHQKAVIYKSTRALMICRRLAGKSWGCNPHIIRWMYTMMVRPIVTYGAIAWGKRTQLETSRKELEKLQRKACICITGAMRTCPTAAIEVLLELTPLHLEVKKTAQRTLVRFCNTEDANKVKVDIDTRINLSEMFPLLNAPSDTIEGRIKPSCKFNVQLSTKSEWVNETIQYNIEPHAIKWYTDGSKTESGAGAGIYGPRTKLSQSLGKYTNIFQAELYAISRCADINLGRNYQNKTIAILTDSQAAIKAINSHKITSASVWECFNTVNTLATHNKVTIYWVPGHVGVDGNEEADKLARHGAETPFHGPEPFCGIGSEIVRNELTKKETILRNEHWENYPRLRQAKELLGGYNRKRYDTAIKLSKNKLRILTGLLTGHCKLREHLHKLNLETNGDCRFCNEAAETPAHILTDCEALIHKRRQYLGSYFINMDEMPSISPLRILEFIKATGLENVL